MSADAVREQQGGVLKRENGVFWVRRIRTPRKRRRRVIWEERFFFPLP
jgi:hypothetical protein